MITERPPGLRLIIAYKLGKAVLQVVVAVALVHGLNHGLAGELTSFADRLKEHAVHASTEAVAAALLRFVGRPHDLLIAAAALGIDGVVSGVEGWVLLRGYTWGPWLVVASTGILLPFELVALVRHPHVGRLVLLAINVAVVTYLARRALRPEAATSSRPAAPTPGRPGSSAAAGPRSRS